MADGARGAAGSQLRKAEPHCRLWGCGDEAAASVACKPVEPARGLVLLRRARTSAAWLIKHPDGCFKHAVAVGCVGERENVASVADVTAVGNRANRELLPS